MTTQPAISIILPSYNGGEYIKKAVKSVLTQNFEDFELIILDDCSTDNTLEIAKALAAEDKRIQVISNEQNLKLPKTLNKGFKIARGRYLTWLSDDNWFKDGALKYMYDYLEANKDYDLISCAMDKVIEKSYELQKKTDNDKTRANAGFLAAYCNVGGCFLFKKEVFEQLKGYDETLVCGEDYEFWCRVALNFTIHYSAENLFAYVVRQGAMSCTHKKILDDTTAEIHKKYAEKILNKYPLKSKDIADIYYQIFKTNNDFNFVKKALNANFGRAFLKFALYYLRNIGK